MLTLLTDFRSSTKVLRNRIVDSWRDHTVSSIAQQHWKSIHSNPRVYSAGSSLYIVQ
jgi:hypothetical protein